MSSVFFFFSSRRRHTRLVSDWSSDVCSSDLGRTAINMTAATTLRCAALPGIIGVKEASGDLDQMGLVCAGKPKGFHVRSEERRVGKECRCRLLALQLNT